MRPAERGAGRDRHLAEADLVAIGIEQEGSTPAEPTELAAITKIPSGQPAGVAVQPEELDPGSVANVSRGSVMLP